MTTPGKKLDELQEIIISLRKPGGCPWDRKQTPDSFKSYLIEEAHELLEAVDQNDPNQIREELGDMLFQLVFLNQLFEEQGLFSLSDVIHTINEKMINRHPHVFGDEEVFSEEDQRRRWNQIKAKEKDETKSVSSLLANVPKSLPGLRRAQRVSERAAHNGFEWQDINAALAKLEEEVAELKEAIHGSDQESIAEELGDTIFVLVNLGRLTKINSEDALHGATNKFIKRFSHLEKKITRSGKKIDDISYQGLIELWTSVKKELA